MSDPNLSRRQFLVRAGVAMLTGLAMTGYAFAIEPFRLRVQCYSLIPRGWSPNHKLKIAVLADLHACKPWMTAKRLRSIVERTNALEPDLILLLGDYTASHRFVTGRVADEDWADALGGLKAELGVHAIMGNHDWWEDEDAQRRGHGPIKAEVALNKVGIRTYENDAIRIERDLPFGKFPFWLAGLGDQLALLPNRENGRSRLKGMDDLEGTLAKITDDAPVILMVHEPDIFPQIPKRVSLTLAGHTHGGQVRFLGYSPVVPSRYENRYAYGHIIENRFDDIPGKSIPDIREMIVSGGLGCSIVPMRAGVPPEIVLLELGSHS